jgi:SAM-dependent methyltransferase
MKQNIIKLLRKLHILEQADSARFFLNKWKYWKSNRTFRKENPLIKLPPPFVLYESFGKMDYASYYYGGKESAEYILSLLLKQVEVCNGRILEWGCGPARLLRHFPEFLRHCMTAFYGSDYNRVSIAWCGKYIPGITFLNNRLMPPLDLPADFIDAVYCVSVFTHLSREAQDAWLKEILRVMKPGGVFLMTVHGDVCSRNLNPGESQTYIDTGCVERGEVTEGQRTYTTFNSPEYMKDVFLKGLEIAEHIPGKDNAQDIWIIRKTVI